MAEKIVSHKSLRIAKLDLLHILQGDGYKIPSGVIDFSVDHSGYLVITWRKEENAKEELMSSWKSVNPEKNRNVNPKDR